MTGIYFPQACFALTRKTLFFWSYLFAQTFFSLIFFYRMPPLKKDETDSASSESGQENVTEKIGETAQPQASPALCFNCGIQFSNCINKPFFLIVL